MHKHMFMRMSVKGMGWHPRAANVSVYESWRSVSDSPSFNIEARRHHPMAKDGTLYWLVVEPYPSEKYEFVSWDYYSQLSGKIKNVPNYQPVYIGILETLKPINWWVRTSCVFDPRFLHHSVAVSMGPLSSPSMIWCDIATKKQLLFMLFHALPGTGNINNYF